jgi:uncharacterized protein (TIGR03435 family)
MGLGLYTYSGGRILATGETLKKLIYDGYKVEMYNIVGGPRWVDEDRFDVEAKPPASSKSSKWVPANFKSAPNAEMRQMLQTLLAERFQLKVHTETRKESIYALAVAKGGPKLRPPVSTTVQPFVSFLPHGLSRKERRHGPTRRTPGAHSGTARAQPNWRPGKLRFLDRLPTRRCGYR